jgi:hypothetical protein
MLKRAARAMIKARMEVKIKRYEGSDLREPSWR